MKKKLTVKELLEVMEWMGACPQAMRWVRANSNLTTAQLWNTCSRADWMVWLCGSEGLCIVESDSTIAPAFNALYKALTPAFTKRGITTYLENPGESIDYLRKIAPKENRWRLENLKKCLRGVVEDRDHEMMIIDLGLICQDLEIKVPTAGTKIVRETFKWTMVQDSLFDYLNYIPDEDWYK